MSWRRICPAFAMLALVGCAATPAPDCTAAGIWRTESTGGAASCADETLDEEASSARFLAAEHARLAARLSTLNGQPELAGRERLERVELIRELEQIAGVAIVRGWTGDAQGRQKQ